MARRKVEPDDNRDANSIRVGCTVAERKELTAAAKRAGIPRSKFVRLAALEKARAGEL